MESQLDLQMKCEVHLLRSLAIETIHNLIFMVQDEAVKATKLWHSQGTVGKLCCEILLFSDLRRVTIPDQVKTVQDKLGDMLRNMQDKMEQQQNKTNRLLDELATLRNTTMDGTYVGYRSGHMHTEVLLDHTLFLTFLPQLTVSHNFCMPTSIKIDRPIVYAVLNTGGRTHVKAAHRVHALLSTSSFLISLRTSFTLDGGSAFRSSDGKYLPRNC